MHRTGRFDSPRLHQSSIRRIRWRLEHLLLSVFALAFITMLGMHSQVVADEANSIGSAQSDIDFGSSKKAKVDKVRTEEERFDSSNDAPIREVPRLVNNLDGFSSLICDIAFHPNGRHIAVACANEIQVWDVETDRLLSKIRGALDPNSGAIYDIAYSPGGNWLMIGIETSRGSYVRCCKTDDYTTTFGYTGAGMEYARGCTTLDFTGDGEHLLVQTYFEEYVNDDPDDYTTEQLFRQTLYKFIENPTNNEVDPVLLEDYDSEGEHGPLTFYGSNAYGYDVYADRTLDVANNRVVAGAVGGDSRWLKRIYQHAEAKAKESGGEQTWFDADVNTRIAAVGMTTGSGGSARYQVELYRGDSLVPYSVFKRVRWEVTALDISADSKRLAIGDALGNFQVIDLDSTEVLFSKSPSLRPLYAAALDVDTGLLGLGRRPNSGSEWKQNSYAKIDEAFDLVQREFVDASRGTFRDPVTSFPPPINVSVKQMVTKDQYRFLKLSTPTKTILRTEEQGSMIFSWHFQPGSQGSPLILYGGTSFLQAETLGTPKPSNSNVISLLSAECEAIAMDITPTKRNKYVVTAWSDGIARIYRNDDLTPQVGFQTPIMWEQSEETGKISVIEVRDEDAAGGLKVGDVITAVAGIDPMVHSNRSSSDYGFERNVVPGSLLPITRENGEIVNAKYLPFDDHFIRAVDPVLSFLSTSNGDWILFTPEGLFDASPGASRLIGWQRNRGFDQTADFFSAQLLRRKLQRPDLIQERVHEILGRKPASTSTNSNASIPTAGTDISTPPSANAPATPDLREPTTLNQILPPKLRIEGVPEDGKTRESEIELVVTAAPQNDLRVREIVVLSGGRPTGTIKNIERLDNGQLVLTTRIKLNAGDNELSFIATNEAASSPRRTVNITCTAQPLAAGELQPRLFILSVGVSEYKNDDFDLKYPAADAKS
ncbi:MAG: WD40 repeat domain-containing protein, partial [Rhodopirellula sp. JB053]